MIGYLIPLWLKIIHIGKVKHERPNHKIKPTQKDARLILALSFKSEMSEELTTAQRYKLVEDCFGSVLTEHGFSNSGSKKGVFWRKTEEGIYHYVAAWRALRKPKYDIMVIAFHPSFDDEFESKHPDDIGCPINGYLHSKFGVGVRAEQLFCRTEEVFRRDFEKRVKGMLTDHAVPFLNKIQNLNDLEPLITAPGIKKKLNKLIQPTPKSGAAD